MNAHPQFEEFLAKTLHTVVAGNRVSIIMHALHQSELRVG